MKKHIFYLMVALFFASCGEKEITIPQGVLNQKEMTGILTDFHIAQSSISNAMFNDSSVYTISDYLNYILEQHHTEKNDFLNSLKFYGDHPEMLQQVYDSVITTLNKIEVKTEK